MKGAKQGVNSPMTLSSKPGRSSEQHYSQNERKMAYSIGNKFKPWRALFCFTPASWLHLNKYKFALSHKHSGEIPYCRGRQCLHPAQEPTQNFLRRPEIFSFTPTCLWRLLHSTTGDSLKPPLCHMARWLKQHWGCATPGLAAPEIRPPFSGFILPQVPSLDTFVLPFSAKHWKRLMGWLWHDANTWQGFWGWTRCTQPAQIADKMCSYLIAKDHVDRAWHGFDASQTQFAVFFSSRIYIVTLRLYFFSLKIITSGLSQCIRISASMYTFALKGMSKL